MKRSKTFVITSVLSIGSILLTALIIFVERNTISTYEENRPYLVLGEYMKNLSTKSHLWFEEAMAGDNSIDVNNDVFQQLNKCLEMLASAKEGRETELGRFYKSNDQQTITALNESIQNVENLLSSAKQRWNFKIEHEALRSDSTQLATGEQAGGKLDQEFDAAYEELQTTFERLTSIVNKKVETDSGFLNSLSWVSIVLIAFTLGILCFYIYRILKGNDGLMHESSVQLDEEAKRVQTLTAFLEKVSNGNFEMELDTANELNARLLAIRNKLKDNADEETRRNWSTTGLAQIGEILRGSYSVSTDLYDQVLRFIVKYTNSNQGGMFLIGDTGKNDNHLVMVACYAFERKKYLNKRIDAGEGLVGQCFVEREVIYMTEIPQQYIQITSGLGSATPSSLLILPLKINEEIVGVMELASFNDYTLHEIELIKKFAESIASTISTVRINEKTKLLLSQTQQQAEEMRSQEEEMRQNMEELSATQEEMGRKEKEYVRKIEELEKKLVVLAN